MLIIYICIIFLSDFYIGYKLTAHNKRNEGGLVSEASTKPLVIYIILKQITNINFLYKF